MRVAERLAGSHREDRQEGARADRLMGTWGQRGNGRGVEQDAQTPVGLSGGTVLMNQNRASGGRGWPGRLPDSSRLEAGLEETPGCRCPRSRWTGMSGAEERSGLEILKSHQHLDRIGSVGGVRSCRGSAAGPGKRTGQASNLEADSPAADLHSVRPQLQHPPSGTSLWRPPAPAGRSGPGGGPAGGLPRAHSLVGKGRDVLQQLPRDSLQNDILEGGVV